MKPSEYSPDWAAALRRWAEVEHVDTLCCCREWRPDCRHRPNMRRGGDTCLMVGRCKSGRRWFWAVCVVGTDDWTGDRVDTEADAVDAIAAEVVRVAGERRVATLCFNAGAASMRLARRNKAERAERIAAKPPSKDTDAAPIEYLYSLNRLDVYGPPLEHRITRKTAKRIYFREFGATRWRREVETYVDRAALERDGHIWHGGSGYHLWASPSDVSESVRRYCRQPEQATAAPVTLSDLKRAMADAHPDRGGDRDAFQQARRAYLRAKAAAQ